MRAYGITDQIPDDDEEYSRVVPLRTGSRGRAVGPSDRARPEPWTPRDTTLPAGPARPAAPPPRLEPRLGRAHRFLSLIHI